MRRRLTSGSDNWTRYVEHMEAHDPEPSAPNARVQWKGTDVCIDIRCECGARGHVDGASFYQYRCNHCGRVYGVSPYVRLVPLPDGTQEPDMMREDTTEQGVTPP